MKISNTGLEFIKSFEGCDLVAKKYKGEKYYTIGHGHYGPDVKPGQTITKEEAFELLKNDMAVYEQAVERQTSYLGGLKQNEFDALVSFCYNLGEGCVKQLTGNYTRSKEEISNHFTAYVNSGNPANREGLLRRRKAEREMFLNGKNENSEEARTTHDYLAIMTAKKDAVPLRKSASHTENNVITYLDAGTPLCLVGHANDNFGIAPQGYFNLDDFEFQIIKHVKVNKNGAPLRKSASHTEDNVIQFLNAGTELDILEYSENDNFGRAIQGWINIDDCE